MSNTITAYFKGRVGVAESVYQNDYGIVMAFDSIDLPAHFDCYFSRLNQEEALPGLGADNRVTIPNSILANPGNVTIHIPLHTGEDDSEVEYVIYFKVIGRARPIDDGTPAQMTAIERALALLSQPITNIEEIVNEALSFTGDTFAEMKQELADDFAEYKGDVDDDIADFKTEIRGDIADVEHDFDILDGQFQTAVAAITVDSEVQGIRTGDDGVTYTSAGEAVRKQFSDVKSTLGVFKYSQYKKARHMVVAPSLSVNDVFYFKPLTWSGASWTQISVQGLYNGNYTTLARATALNQELYFVADKQYESFFISVNVSAVPTENTTFEFILRNINDLTNLAGYVANNDYNKFKFRGYLPENANVNTTVLSGWYLLASARISGTTGLPSDISADSVLRVYNGSLTLQTLQELSYPFRSYQRYLYSSNTQQSSWIRTNISANNKKMYLFGDSLTKGVLSGGGTGTSYLELAARTLGYEPVNCGIGGIGYVYSAKKLTSEVPWNTGEGRIRAQDVIEHYAPDLINADTVVLAYGVNDWQTLGDSGTTIAEADRRATSSNIIANVKAAIETVKNAHPGVRIIVVTPVNTSYRGGSVSSGYALNTSLNNNGDGKEAMTLEKTYQAIVDACNYYGVAYIDMTHNNAAVNFLNITGVLPDGLHPSQNTYNRLAETLTHRAVG